jgi:hypothetical protein
LFNDGELPLAALRQSSAGGTDGTGLPLGLDQCAKVFWRDQTQSSGDGPLRPGTTLESVERLRNRLPAV